MRDEFWDTEPHYGGDKGEGQAGTLLLPGCLGCSGTPGESLPVRPPARRQPRRPPAAHRPPCRPPAAVIWDALRAAAEADDLETAKVILESAGVVVAAEDMTGCYDELGKRYVLEKYVLSAPSNLIRERSSSASTGSGRRASRGSAQAELPAPAGA